MMKSIFLSESRLLDMDSNTSPSSLDEYILVDSSPDDDDDDDDDDDYDYCDDVSSQGSVRSDGLHLLTDDLILEEAAGEPSMERILEEAHASASPLLGASSVSHDNDAAAAGTTHRDHDDANDNDEEQLKCIGDDHEGIANDMPGILESSASDNSLSSHHHHQDHQAGDDDGADDSVEKLPQNSTMPTMATRTTKNNATTMVQGQEAPSSMMIHFCLANEPVLEPESKPQFGGRMSNKKRRKKMKQMKKAAAAAKAAVALSSTSSSSSTSSATNTDTNNVISASGSIGDCKSSTKASIYLTSRYNKKRVANIAVACATESLASYKAQIAALSKKVD